VIERAVIEALRQARYVAVLTGAGVSRESGIATFREALTGLWENFDPEELATPGAFARNPSTVWRWYRSRRLAIESAEPNAGHRALARLETLVPAFTLVTQNVDGLHQRAGSQDVVELHGNIARVKCSRDGQVVSDFVDSDEVPSCPRCGAPLRPDVVWFGEFLPPDMMAQAERAARSCDVFLSVGTSNMVEPAASLPWQARDAGALVVVVNPTALGQQSGPNVEIVLGESGQVLPRLVDTVWPKG
jgi:NAD-dependent deacetylase